MQLTRLTPKFSDSFGGECYRTEAFKIVGNIWSSWDLRPVELLGYWSRWLEIHSVRCLQRRAEPTLGSVASSSFLWRHDFDWKNQEKHPSQWILLKETILRHSQRSVALRQKLKRMKIKRTMKKSCRTCLTHVRTRHSLCGTWHGMGIGLILGVQQEARARFAEHRSENSTKGPASRWYQLRQSLICSVRPDLNSKSTELWNLGLWKHRHWGWCLIRLAGLEGRKELRSEGVVKINHWCLRYPFQANCFHDLLSCHPQKILSQHFGNSPQFQGVFASAKKDFTEKSAVLLKLPKLIPQELAATKDYAETQRSGACKI